jgi:hypothetical protein
MSMPSPNPSGPRMSRGIKLVLMGVAGAALLYSCTPSMMGGGGFFWLLPWLFRGGPGVTAPATPGQSATTTKQSPTQTAPTQSQRGGFGSTGSSGGSSGSS